jgi:hypothetical protein
MSPSLLSLYSQDEEQDMMRTQLKTAGAPGPGIFENTKRQLA